VSLLEVRGLAIGFGQDEKVVRPVSDIGFSLSKGGTLGLVGESGSGKSLTALAIMGLLPPGARVLAGEILFEGVNVLTLDERERRKLRGRRIAMIFQEPMSALNPVMRIGDQIGEVARTHFGASRSTARDSAVKLLTQVGIPSPERRVDAYPHELSGGMRQRVMIAMALAGEPELLIADEPTTALDVTIQAQILELLRSIRTERSMSMLLVTHDLGVVAEQADDVCVVYAGEVVERAKTTELFVSPRHPYTRGLLESLPSFGRHLERERLPSIPGNVPTAGELPTGCYFAPRCKKADEACKAHPAFESSEQGAFRCFHPEGKT
jgi:peptide/nickel transport system ATP-binding protein